MSLRRLNLALRSALCFGVFCLLMVALGVSALREAATLHNVGNYFQQHIVPAVKELGDMDSNFSDIRFANSKLRNTQESPEVRQAALADVEQLRARLEGNLQVLSGLRLDANERRDLEALQAGVKRYDQVRSHYMALVNGGDMEGAIRFSQGELNQASLELQTQIAALVASNDRSTQAYGLEAQGAFEETFTLVSSYIVVALLVCVVMAWLYTRSVLQPLRQALAIAERIADNDLSEAILVEGHDEAARLLAALARMQANLCDALGKISDSSTQLAATSKQMSVITDEASSGIQRQAGEVDMAATAVTQMSAAIDEVARNAASALEVAGYSSEAADRGCLRVNETLAAIHQMVDRVQETSGSVKELTGVVVDVNVVLADIRAVAEQTNLLALNAAIEAARAGEAGRGFAVVADEVRALARRTQEATRNIEQMMGGVQARSDVALEAMQQTSEQAERTRQLSSAAGSALEEIHQAIGQINQTSVQIATAAEQQAAVAHEVDRSLISIRDLAAHTNEGAQHTSIASSELAYLATDLSQLVKRFSL